MINDFHLVIFLWICFFAFSLDSNCRFISGIGRGEIMWIRVMLLNVNWRIHSLIILKCVVKCRQAISISHFLIMLRCLFLCISFVILIIAPQLHSFPMITLNAIVSPLKFSTFCKFKAGCLDFDLARTKQVCIQQPFCYIYEQQYLT